ncbi:TetR/AcrR family transcriptional regulator [Herbiconiux sp. P17]|uniref:TetR/AcrR family transcriptional regulator n=1 Tax=Herbiconiux wuyangfengii TaxID=3342794 RepID=UPI0035B6C046
MRYSAAHKAQTRDRIVTTAARRFRAGGIADVGIAGIMTEADLTNGAFYAHFDSKDDLVRQAVVETLQAQRDEMLSQAEDHDLRALVAGYLSSSHRDLPADGCPSAAMLAEIGRGSEALKTAYHDALAPTLDLIVSLLPGDPRTAHRRATAIFALLVGTMQLARVIVDRQESDTVLASGIEAAMGVAAS